MSDDSYFETDSFGYPWWDGMGNYDDVAIEARRRTIKEYEAKLTRQGAVINVPDKIYRIIASLMRLINHTGFDNIKRLSASLGVRDDGFPSEEDWNDLIAWMYPTPNIDADDEAR